MKQILKKNQIIISVIAIMLIAAGYMNYTSNEKQALETAVLTDSEKYAGIGDATLVSANVADNNDLVNNNEAQNITDESTKNEDKKDKIKSNEQNTEIKEKFIDDRGYFMKDYDENIFLHYIYMGLKKYRSKKINLRYVLKGYTEQIFALIYYHCHYSSGNVAVYGKVEFEMLSLLSMKEKLLLVFFDVISIILIIIAFMLVFV